MLRKLAILLLLSAPVFAQEQPQSPQQKELIATCIAIQQQRNNALDSAADLSGKLQSAQARIAELEAQLKVLESKK